MPIGDRIRDEKLHCDINRKGKNIANISLINIKILLVKKQYLSDQSRTREEAKFTYSPLRKALKKRTKTLKDNVKNKEKQLKGMEKQTKTLKILEPNDQEPNNKIFDNLVKEKTKEIAEFEETN